MPVSSLHVLGQVVTAAGTIRGIQNFDLDPGIEKQVLYGDGVVDPTFSAVMFQSPMLRFTTTAIASALTMAGIGGYAITATATAYFQQIAAGGTRSGGATSKSLALSKGMLVPVQIEASDGGVATAQMQIFAISTNGIAAPVIYASGVTMPAAAALTEHFTVGPAWFGDGETDRVISSVRRLTIDAGLDVGVRGGGGEVYPTFAGIQRRTPSLTLRTDDLSLLDLAFPLTGGHVGINLADFPLTAYLTKLKKGGTRVANATEEHIAIVVNDGMMVGRTVGGDDGQPQELELTVDATSNLTDDVLAINLASAISLPE